MLDIRAEGLMFIEIVVGQSVLITYVFLFNQEHIGVPTEIGDVNMQHGLHPIQEMVNMEPVYGDI